MGKKGDFTNPEFVLENGVVLQLKRTRNMLNMAFKMEWERKNPAPVPVKYQADNGEWLEDVHEENYKKRRAEWEGHNNYAMLMFLFKSCIVTQPPADFSPDEKLHDDPKLNWIINIITDDEWNTLPNAIQGLDEPTKAGLEDAEKN